MADDDPRRHGQPQSPVVTSGRGHSASERCDVAEASCLRNASRGRSVDQAHDHDGDCASVRRAGDETVGPRPETALSITDGDAVGRKEDAVVSDEPTPSELRDLEDELASIRSALASPPDAEDDASLLLVRAWRHRTDRSIGDPTKRLRTQRLVPMTAPTGQLSPLIQAEDVELLRVMGFDDGVYRGQVKRCAVEASLMGESREGEAQDRLVPHGWGIATSRTGLRRVGQWHLGGQVGVGSLQSAVFLYDGEWHATAGPSGYGIGTFAFGATFVGCWHLGKPYGLGRLQTFETNRTECGWFYGTRCVQRVAIEGIEELHADCLKRHLPAQRFDEQPQRGLFLVGQILEETRLSSLRLALEQWRRVACGHAIEQARTARADAMAAWVEAHASEQDALAWHISNEMQAYRILMAPMLEQVTAGRQHHARVQRIREFHTNKLHAAIFQRDLARRCVLSQEESVAFMETELSEVATLLEEATIAQAECQRLATQQQATKRQIEHAHVKINALRQHLRRREEDSEDRQQQQQHDMAREEVQTPTTPSSRAKAFHGSRLIAKLPQPNGDGEVRTPPFVCDVSGCSCGIPRHVFTRVGAALNGE